MKKYVVITPRTEEIKSAAEKLPAPVVILDMPSAGESFDSSALFSFKFYSDHSFFKPVHDCVSSDLHTFMSSLSLHNGVDVDRFEKAFPGRPLEAVVASVRYCFCLDVWAICPDVFSSSFSKDLDALGFYFLKPVVDLESFLQNMRSVLKSVYLLSEEDSVYFAPFFLDMFLDGLSSISGDISNVQKG